MTELQRLTNVLRGTVITFMDNRDGRILEANRESVVRAILQAMREPSEGQYNALCATGKMWRELDSKTVWQTYIDHILNEKEGEA